MMVATPTHYSSLPSMPQLNAMPQGVPSGPWGPLYRSAPGAQLPAVSFGAEGDKKWYQKWWVWGLVGVGVAGAGAVYFMRR